jgi:methionine-rich copper-binding protein CopC
MRKLIDALLVGLVGSLLMVGTAFAHAAYLRSEPGAGAIIAAPPTRVDIWFEQELFRRQGENTIQVTGPEGTTVSIGETMLDDDDRKHLWIDLQPGLPPGEYQVAWKNLSLEDGHPTDGTFSFMLDPQAAVTSTPMADPDSIAPTESPAPTVAQPSPTLAESPTPQPSAGLPCASAMIPLLGLAAPVLVRRWRQDQIDEK